jgi:hypothetical protein
MKKGKKMPSIELDGHSEATFALVDGKIVRIPAASAAPHMPSHSFEPRLRRD